MSEMRIVVILLSLAVFGCKTSGPTIITQAYSRGEKRSQADLIEFLSTKLRGSDITLYERYGQWYRIESVSASAIICYGSRRQILGVQTSPMIGNKALVTTTYRDVDLPPCELSFDQISRIEVGKLGTSYDSYIAFYSSNGSSVGRILIRSKHFELDEVLQALLAMCPNVK